MSTENSLQDGHEIPAILDVEGLVEHVEDLVKQRRFPIKLQHPNTGVGRQAAATFSYWIPPSGFTSGENGHIGVIVSTGEPMSFVDGDRNDLGAGERVTVSGVEAVEIDKQIAEAKQQFDL